MNWIIAFSAVSVGSFAMGAFLMYCRMLARLDRLATVRAQTGASAVGTFREYGDRWHGAEQRQAPVRTQPRRTGRPVPNGVEYAPAD